MSLDRQAFHVHLSYNFCELGQSFISACKKRLGDAPEAVDKLLHLHTNSKFVSELVAGLKNEIMAEEKNSLNFKLSLASNEIQQQDSLQVLLKAFNTEKHKIQSLQKGINLLNQQYSSVLKSITDQQIVAGLENFSDSLVEPIIKFFLEIGKANNEKVNEKHKQLQDRKEKISYFYHQDITQLKEAQKKSEDRCVFLKNEINKLEENFEARIRQQRRLFYSAVSKPVMLFCMLIYHATKNFYQEAQLIQGEITKEEKLKKLEQIASRDDFCLVDLDEQQEIWKEPDILKVKDVSREIVKFLAKMQTLLRTLWCPECGNKKGNALYGRMKNILEEALTNEKFSIQDIKINIPEMSFKKVDIEELANKLIPIPSELIQEHDNLSQWFFGPHLRCLVDTSKEHPLSTLQTTYL